MIKNPFWKMLILSYLFGFIAQAASYYNSLVMLVFGILLSYWVIVIKFPMYKKSMEDTDGKEL